MARRAVVLLSPGMNQLLNSAAMAAAMRRRAEPVAATARSNAPVESGGYRDGIRVESATTDRAVARVIATADHSMAVEADTGNLVRALGSAG